MPLAEVALVLDGEGRGAGGAAAHVVAAHEQRLFDGLPRLQGDRAHLALLSERDGAGAATAAVRLRVTELLAALGSAWFAVALGQPWQGRRTGRACACSRGSFPRRRSTALTVALSLPC